MLLQDLSTVTPTGDGRYIQKTHLIIDEGPELDYVHKLRIANSFRQNGFSDERLMRFRAAIPVERVWEAEHVLGFNLSDKKDFRKYLILHPEFIITPECTGRSPQIIVKGG